MANPRTRTRSQTVTDSYQLQRWINPAPEPPWLSGSVNVAASDSMTDTVTPGYFSAVRKGGVLTVNPMSQVQRQIYFMGDCDVIWKRRNSTYPTFAFRGNAVAAMGRLNPWRLWSETTAPAAPSAAPLLQKALADARNSGWDVLTFAAEFNKTADMLRRAGTTFDKRARTIYDRVIRYRRQSPRDLLQVFSEMWLEYRYGWRTLVFDLQDAAGALQSYGKQTSDLVRSTSSASADKAAVFSWSTESVFVDPGSTVSGGLRFHHIAQDTSYARVRCGVGLEGMLEVSPFQANPLVTAWELLPYSFVVDWFFNIGEAVSAWAPFTRGRVAYGFTSVESVRERVITSTPVNTGFESVSGRVGNSVSVSRLVSKIRQPANPSLDIRFRLNLDSAKVTDLVAMLLQGHAKRLKGLAMRR